MLKVKILLISLVLPICGNAQVDVFDRLAVELNFRLNWQSRPGEQGEISFEYCPTNKCDLFVSKHSNLSDFAAFIDMYVVFLGAWGDLSRYSAARGVPPIRYIEDRIQDLDLTGLLSEECKRGTSLEGIVCTLNSYVSDLEIEKFFVTYDVGERYVAPDETWKTVELDAEAVRDNLRWYETWELLEEGDPRFSE